MTSPVDLCNLALDQISARSNITGISPPSPPGNLSAQVATRTYQPQVNAVFRAAHWNSARLQKPLTLLKAAVGTPENPSGYDSNGNLVPVPPVPWRYEYSWPSDCLLLRFVIPRPNVPIAGSAPIMTSVGISNQPLVNTAMPFVPAIDDDLSGNQIKVILTNAQKAQAVYTARIDNCDLWDASLQNAVIGVLAAWFAMPITGDKSLVSMRTQIAVGLINDARRNDSNEGITSVDTVPDWMSVRNAGSGWGGLGAGDGWSGGPFIGNWASIGMPDGISY